MKKKISYSSYLISLALFLVVIWGQTKDETLLTSVKNNAQLIPLTTLPKEQNAFFAMLGFNILDSTKFISEGYQSLAEATKKAQQKPLDFMQHFELPKTYDKDLLLYQLPCDINQTNQDCLNDVLAQKNIIQQYLKEQYKFIDNYLVLQKYTNFAHLFPRNVNASLPLLYTSNISQLLTAKAILDIEAGKIDQGMRFILADIQFYRNMLRSEQRSLEETNAFINALSQLYFVVDRLAHSGINLTPYQTELTPLLAPLSKEQRSLVWALENERDIQLITEIALGYQNFYTGANEIAGCQQNSCDFSRYFLRLIYKFNATLNAIYRDWQPMIDFAKQDTPLDENFLTQLKLLQQIELNHHSITTLRLFERYGFFLYKNFEGEKQKNNIYYAEGYTLWFIKVYVLNNTIQQLNIALQNSHWKN